MDMRRYKCRICGAIYDPAVGDPSRGIPAGTPFAELPDDWRCPLCQMPKSEFDPVEDAPAPKAEPADFRVRIVRKTMLTGDNLIKTEMNSIYDAVRQTAAAAAKAPAEGTASEAGKAPAEEEKTTKDGIRLTLGGR